MTILIAKPQTHLYTIRLWFESIGSGEYEARYQVRHILSGETRYFRNWCASHAFMLEKAEFDEQGDAKSSLVSNLHQRRIS